MGTKNKRTINQKHAEYLDLLSVYNGIDIYHQKIIINQKGVNNVFKYPKVYNAINKLRLNYGYKLLMIIGTTKAE